MWENGECKEMLPAKVEDEVKFNWENVRAVAAIVGYTDGRGLQMLTEYGVTHGTEDFPMSTYGARNHQGASSQIASLNAMFREKEDDGHFWADDEGCWSDHPRILPTGVVPCNGSLGREKEPEMRKKLAGLPYEVNMRGTWGGSSLHHGSSINDHCTLHLRKYKGD